MEYKKEMIKKIKTFRKKIRDSHKAAREFLVSTGIYTEKGNLKKPYK